MSSGFQSLLHKDGVVRIPKLFSSDEMCGLRRAVFETLIHTDERRQYHEGGHIQWRTLCDKKWPAIIFWPALVNEELRNFRRNTKFVSVIRSFLEGNIRQMNNQLYLRLPGDGDEFNIHQDYMFRREIRNHDLILKSYIQTAVAIDPVDESNGGIEFFLGSHRAGLLELVNGDRSNLRRYEKSNRDLLEKNYKGLVFHLDPGDMLVWNLLIAHGSRANASDRTRMTYMNGFCDSAASDSWPSYVENGQLVELDAAMIPLKT